MSDASHDSPIGRAVLGGGRQRRNPSSLWMSVLAISLGLGVAGLVYYVLREYLGY